MKDVTCSFSDLFFVWGLQQKKTALKLLFLKCVHLHFLSNACEHKTELKLLKKCRKGQKSLE